MPARTFRFSVLGRYPAQLRDNATSVTVTMAAGEGDHVVHCGTLTMAEAEWDDFVDALRQALGDRIEVLDPAGSA